MSYIFPSDNARSCDSELNEACERIEELMDQLARRQALEVEPFTWVFTDVNGKASEIAGDPVHRSPQDLRVYTPLYTHPVSDVPDAEYIRTLQDAFDIIQADANTEQNYGSLCRMGWVLARLKSVQEQDDE